MIIALLALACSSEPAAPPPPKTDVPVAAPAPAPTKAQKAASLANAIAKDPSRADAILAENATNRADFEALLYEIAGDSAMSAEYTAARAAP